MNNYYEFTKLIEDGESIDIYSSASNQKLKEILNDIFNDIDYRTDEAAKAFKIFFKGRDYDEYYYSMMVLLEELNDIKIILNILKERDINE